jgi:hypothetical protein
LLRSKYTKVDSKGNLKNTEILQGGREGGREGGTVKSRSTRKL